VRLDIFTLFPHAFDWFLEQVHVLRAIDRGLRVRLCNYRDYTPLPAGQVDDAPYGGGAGMVVRIDVVCTALEAVYGEDCASLKNHLRVIELTPKGRQFDDAFACELAGDDVCLLCGRYEGIDERIAHLVSDRVSIGPYVLSGGEVAAMAVADAMLRKVEGAVSNPESVRAESHSDELAGGTEYPHYTRPAEFRGWAVPPVLLSGDHATIAAWRAQHIGDCTPRSPEGGGAATRT